MAIKVVCFTDHRLTRYRQIATCMYEGVARNGDRPLIADIRSVPPAADVAVMWGWKHRAVLHCYRRFVYADMGYWGRGINFRLTVNGWSPDKYVRGGHPSSRFEQLGIEVKPWRTGGNEIIVAGSTRKACFDHGLKYMEWERNKAHALKGSGTVLYRPKPTDREKHPIPGFGYDERPMDEALSSALALVTHHSNAAIDALVAGVPVQCETGAAAAFSSSVIGERPDGREQFLADVAWLQWSHDEMRNGSAWKHIRKLLDV